jgi:hypothetical protein
LRRVSPSLRRISPVPEVPPIALLFNRPTLSTAAAHFRAFPLIRRNCSNGIPGQREEQCGGLWLRVQSLWRTLLSPYRRTCCGGEKDRIRGRDQTPWVSWYRNVLVHLHFFKLLAIVLQLVPTGSASALMSQPRVRLARSVADGASFPHPSNSLMLRRLNMSSLRPAVYDPRTSFPQASQCGGSGESGRAKSSILSLRWLGLCG